MKIFNLTQKSFLAQHAQIADSFLSRIVGLLNRTHLSQGEALVITRCQQIHMFFMKFPIDAVFIDSSYVVVGLVKNIKPSQLSAIFWKSSRVIELPSGTIIQTKTTLGDQIQFIS